MHERSNGIAMTLAALGLALLSSAVFASDHWAYQKPVDPKVPVVSDPAWSKNPVDAFIFAKLQQNGFKPAPRADRRTLVRRAYFDLIGLPPTPEEADAFINDAAPDAFAKLVDRLLASPHYGERWGRYWLDVARYSDTKGYVFQEERRYPYAYTYRDYVIRSFNEDKPYDRFLLEQIAADQLDLKGDNRPLAAMGFLTLGRRFLNVAPDVIDDRMDVVCRGTMAMTIGCARCHNHKFDPIPTKDYYSLYAIFANSPDAKDPPQIGDSAGSEAFQKELGRRQKEIDDYLAAKFAELAPPLRSAKQISAYLFGTRLEQIDEQAYFSGLGLNRFMFQRWKSYVAAAARKRDPIFSLWRAYAAIPAGEFAAKSGDIAARMAERSPHPLVLAAFINDPPKSLQEVADRYGELLAKFDSPDPRSNADEESLRQVLRGEAAPTNVQMADVVHLFKRDSRDSLTKLKNQIDAFKASSPDAPPHAMALEDAKSIQPQRVFLRGNAGNQGDPVAPHFLTCLSGGDPKPFTHGSGRLELAEAIASKDNPLTARVFVNRVWLHHFGFGLVRTPSDFGTRGDPPTHPELLDYLAVRFMESGWSIKQLHRRIMLSSAYQMSSDITPDAAQRDAQNLLLSHFNRQRLDFEATRDAVLAVTGKLDETVGGRSVDIMLPGEKRRSVYAYIDRQNLPGVFRSFDFASPDTTCARRFVTTVPQQALFMMNSPFLIDQAKNVLIRPEIAAAQEPAERIVRLYRLLFDRSPQAEEISLGAAFVASEDQSPREPIAWQYGYGEYDADAHRVAHFTPFTHYIASTWQASDKLPNKKTGYASLTAGGGHPGDDQKSAVIRRWTAPRDATINIAGAVRHPSDQGDGVRARIVSSRLGELAAWNVFHNEAETALQNVEVRRGDTIDFIVDCKGGPNCDSFAWAPTIRVAETPLVAGTDGPQQWSAAADFGGPEKTIKSLSPWEKYVQVLLESNEFVFVD